MAKTNQIFNNSVDRTVGVKPLAVDLWDWVRRYTVLVRIPCWFGYRAGSDTVLVRAMLALVDWKGEKGA